MRKTFISPRPAAAITPYAPQPTRKQKSVTYYYDGGKTTGVNKTFDLKNNQTALNYFAEYDIIVWGIYDNYAPRNTGSIELLTNIRARRTELGLPRQVFANYIEAGAADHSALDALYRDGTTGVAWYSFNFVPSFHTATTGATMALRGAKDPAWNRNYTVTGNGTNRGSVAASANLTGLTAAVFGDYATVTGGQIWVLVAAPYSTLGNWVRTNKPAGQAFGTVLFTTVNSPANEGFDYATNLGTFASMPNANGVNASVQIAINEAGMITRRGSNGQRAQQFVLYQNYSPYSHAQPWRRHPVTGERCGQILGRLHRADQMSGVMYDAGHLDAIFLDDYQIGPLTYNTIDDTGNADWLGIGTDQSHGDALVNREWRHGIRLFNQDIRDAFPGVELIINSGNHYTAYGSAINSKLTHPGAIGTYEKQLFEGSVFASYSRGTNSSNGYAQSLWKAWAPTMVNSADMVAGCTHPDGVHFSAQSDVLSSAEIVPDRRHTGPDNNRAWECYKLGLAVSKMVGHNGGQLPSFWYEGGLGEPILTPGINRIVIDEHNLVLGEPVDGPQLAPRGEPHEPYIYYREFENVLVIANSHSGNREHPASPVANQAALPGSGASPAVSGSTVYACRNLQTDTWWTHYYGWVDSGISASAYPLAATFGDQKAYPPAGVWKRITSTHGDTVNNGEVIGAGGILLTPMRAVFLVKV